MKKIIRKNIWIIAITLSILTFFISMHVVATERFNENLVIATCVVIVISILSVAWYIYYSDYLKKNDKKAQL